MKKIILNTRPSGGGDEFESILGKNNFKVVNFPTIEIAPVEDFSETNERLEKINDYDGLIFTSGNAVKIFLGRAAEKGIKINCAIYAVGEKTKALIEKAGYECEAVPVKTDSEGLAAMLTGKNRNGKYLFPKGKSGMNRIPDSLPYVDGIIVYETLLPRNKEGIDEVRNMLNRKEVDCIVFFSPSAVKNFFVFFERFEQRNTAVAVIGETTKKKAESLGLTAGIMPEKYSSEELANEIIKYFNE